MHWNVQVVRLKFVKKFIKLIKITNCVCGCIRVCNGCDVAYTATHTHTHNVHTLVELKKRNIAINFKYPSKYRGNLF